MRLCVLHLGSEKTGTSSVQRYLGQHRDALLQDGIWYPRSFASPTAHVHLGLSSAALRDSLKADNPDVAAFATELASIKARDVRMTVFSSEFFHSEMRDRGAVERLKAFLAQHFDAFRLVYYARRQDHMLASMHSTAVQGGWSTNPAALSVYETKGHYYFDHAAICDLWAGVFGRESLVCRIYERERLKNGDVVDDFAAMLGIAPDPKQARLKANESLSFETIHVLLLLNASRHKDNKELRRKLIAAGRRRGGARVPLLTRAEAQEFLSRFTLSNKKFFEHYVDPALAGAFAAGFEGFPQAVPPPPRPREIVEFVFGRGERPR
ncbi:MAG: hypothetical protein JO261_07205 [Alphaproteobacteria bacterium]|nr:hypothetical protein [Alphaproteobacteria bacterium]MBV9693470.1 hypothetical protein [Alphaproteobacteria bacterium]